jgi:glycosyltransferase involved in cell wall biosynthesis
VRAAYNAFDLAVSSSVSESFPNAVAEAMACGVPCVTTNVGDAARIVGDPSLVVRPAEPSALAAAMESVLSRPWTYDDRRGLRARIERSFGVARMIESTESVLREAARAL